MSQAANPAAPPTYVSTGLPTSRLGLWIFLGSEVVIFGGLIVCYVLLRSRHPEWGEAASHTLTPAGAINTMVLLTSSLIVVLAHHAMAKGDHLAARKYLYITVGFGLMFLVVKAFEYHHEIHAGFTPVTGLFWSFYFFMTGLHGLHVVGGMTAMAWVASQLPNNPQRVECVGMYWHVVDIVWIFLFPLLYLAS
jgi:heme/copper-type cytochrome/quinol oxidase subunit 3